MATERKENPGESAYRQVLEDLKQLNCCPSEMRKLYPTKTFNYGEGYGLLLPGNLAYISSESAEDVRTAEEEIRIRSDGWLHPVNWRGIENEIPAEIVNEVLAFTTQVKNQCEELRSEQRQIEMPVLTNS